MHTEVSVSLLIQAFASLTNTQMCGSPSLSLTLLRTLHTARPRLPQQSQIQFPIAPSKDEKNKILSCGIGIFPFASCTAEHQYASFSCRSSRSVPSPTFPRSPVSTRAGGRQVDRPKPPSCLNCPALNTPSGPRNGKFNHLHIA
jgi:hypothetical protein